MIKKNKHIKIFQDKKLLLFNDFAKKMFKKKNIKWVVVGGLDNLPNKIGRDVDIILKEKKNIKIIQKTFINCLKKFKITNIILKNEKFFGDVLIAFDDNFNYYELDIKPYSLRSSFFSISPNWNESFTKMGNFYIDSSCYAFKNYFSSRKRQKKVLSNFRNIKYPYWLKLYMDYKIKNKNLNFFSFSLISLLYIITNPISSFINLFKGLNDKISFAKYEHAPIFFIKNKKIEKNVLKYIDEYLLTIFRGVKCIDKSFFLRNIYFRFYKINDKNFFSKFIFNLFFFIRGFNNKNKFEKLNFFYTLNKNNNFKTCGIYKKNKKFILSTIVNGIKKIDN